LTLPIGFGNLPKERRVSMLNEVALVGRLTKDPEVLETVNGKKRASIVLAVPRQYKNLDGLYETDFIRVILWNVVALNTKEYCKSGDLIGIKGRLQVSSYKDSDDNMKYATDVIAEKISFLSSKRLDVETDEEKNE